jgi:exonuclease VII small subunit
MNLDGTRIYNEGVEIDHSCEEKIHLITKAIRSMSPTSEVGMRLVKSGRIYEGLLWGQANDIPIGIYNRGPSLAHVLDTLLRKVKKECLRIWKANSVRLQTKETSQNQKPSPMALAG